VRITCAIIVLLAVTSSYARSECECLWEGSFSEVQAGADLVIAGAVTQGKGNSIDVALQQPLRGTSHTESVRIWLKSADYCRPEPELFPVGSQWVMALERINEEVPGGFDPNTPNVSYGRVGDYSLSSCGGYWLKLSDGWVTGNLVNAPRWVHDPKMTPVLLELLEDYIAGRTDADALREASEMDPAVRELMLDTRAFLRESGQLPRTDQ
jgi:hypothetical protein